MSELITEPRDIGLEGGATLAFGALMLMVSVLFMYALPWWQPLLWAGVYNALLWWRRWYLLRLPGADGGKFKNLRRRAYWVCAAWAGSAAFWLFVPDSPMMHGVLTFGLLCVITSTVLESVGDGLRVALSLFFVMSPTAVRFLFQEDAISVTLGAGAFIAGPAWWELWRRQQRIWREQYDLRQRAEQGARALAESTLAKSRFFAAANHDLRQPVHALGLYLDMLERQPLNREGLAARSGAKRAWEALSTQLNQLLDLARADAGALRPQMERVLLADVLKSQVDHHGIPAMSKGQRLIIRGGDGCHVDADPLMLARVLDNLVGNAIKFSPRGATVALMVRRGGSGAWCIQVRDNGPGIPLAEQKGIFEDFVQGGNGHRDRRAGYGLGLAIARRFTEAMGGTIAVRSCEGRGSVFSVRLSTSIGGDPVVLKFAQEAEGVVPTQGLHRPSTIRRLLLLEDDELVTDAMRALADDWGLPLVVAAESSEILAVARLGDVALCDIRLPNGESGVAVAAALQERDIPSALISGEVASDVLSEAAKHRLELVIKPVSATQLHHVLVRLAPS